ncbi:hypothetical protein [Natrarchaeobaculum aegyptiacum]|uniref:Uncharacterized protein n=1 Tax=Natrarchaeobaculum aegyptiacum TaxID=745377 RepID=A0A2Z2HQK0_9EURY|nr:hypothetical protein [Natrarchaeobaculum aegyptiacum]ARS89430.1 hypothetical protein B1756_06510 [Natrarchaeobaculum aegyptiacum]
MDRIDTVAIVGISLLALSTTALEPLLVTAAFGGFLLSLSVWRLYGGRPWEALGWLAWVVAAVAVILDLGGMATLVAVVVFGGLGVIALLGGRFGILVDVWSVD